MRKLFLTAILILSAFVLGAQNSIKVQTHKVVAADEKLNVTFVIDGKVSDSDFSWKPSADFQLLWGPQRGHSSSIQIINGKTTKSSQTTFSYILRPLKTGKFTLPRARAKIDGKEIVSKAETIEVVGANQQAQQPAQRSQPTGSDLFLAINVNKTNVVVGEPIRATISIYTRENIASFESAQFPKFKGFWSQEEATPTNIKFSRVEYNGQLYNAALLKKYLLVPRQKGILTIDPAEIVCLVNVRTAPFGNGTFDGFFDSVTTVRKKAVSSAVKIKVTELPADEPASLDGGEDQFLIVKIGQGQNQSGSESMISPQAAQQMLQSIQAKEKEAQDKVNMEKVAVLGTRKKEKNW